MRAKLMLTVYSGRSKLFECYDCGQQYFDRKRWFAHECPSNDEDFRQAVNRICQEAEREMVAWKRQQRIADAIRAHGLGVML